MIKSPGVSQLHPIYFQLLSFVRVAFQKNRYKHLSKTERDLLFQLKKCQKCYIIVFLSDLLMIQ